MKKYGCYIIKEKFFEDFNDPYLKSNKKENRPHYCCFPDDENSDLYWVIPMSHRINKYEKMIKDRESQNKPCDIVHIIEVGGGKSVLLIQDMFPITQEYIERPYTINGQPLVIHQKKYTEVIEQKAKNIKRLIHRKVKLNPTQPDVLSIKFKLLANLEKSESKTLIKPN